MNRRTLLGYAATGFIALRTGIGNDRVATNSSLLKFGSLITDETRGEFTNGFRIGMQELEWSTAEPTNGHVNARYWQQQRAWRDALSKSGAGYDLCLALGMHNETPLWLNGAVANARLVSELSEPGLVDFIWNKDVRYYGERWLRRINYELGLSNYRHIRLTNPPCMEAMVNERGTFDAYGPNPQGLGRQLPTSVTAAPFIGWRPGGREISIEQVTQWIDWYYGSVAKMIMWQINCLRRLGFRGDFEVVCPGEGASPSDLRRVIGSRLVGGASNLVGMGAAWHKLFENLRNKADLNVHCSSVGERPDDLWTADAQSVPLDSDQYDSHGAAWRMKRISTEFGIGISGESPGFSDSDPNYYRDSSHRGLLYNATAQAQAAGFSRFYWAHSANIGVDGPDLPSFKSRMSAMAAGR